MQLSIAITQHDTQPAHHPWLLRQLAVLMLGLLFTFSTQATTLTGKQAASSTDLGTPGQTTADIKNTERKLTYKFHKGQPRIQALAADSTQQSVYRPAQLQASNRAYYFSIYDAWVQLHNDLDADGYYSEFTLEFDADYDGGYANVYAELYLSHEGGPWVHYHTTDIFTIHSVSGSDAYRVRSVLHTNFPTGSYDILIDLYEAGHPGLIATLGPADDNDLYTITLEDREHEFQNRDYWFERVTTRLLDDFDADGFYQTISLEFSANTLFPNSVVFARVIINHPTGAWQEIITGEPFYFDNNGNTTQQIDIVLENGFPPDTYNIDIQLLSWPYEHALALAAQEFSALSQVPLESLEYDGQHHGETQTDLSSAESGVSSTESGGGSVNWAIIGILCWLTLRKGRINCNTKK